LKWASKFLKVPKPDSSATRLIDHLLERSNPFAFSVRRAITYCWNVIPEDR